MFIKVVYKRVKGIEFCHKQWFSNLNIFATQCRRPLIFQTTNSARWNNLSLKYQRFSPLDCKNKGIRKSEFVAKNQFLYLWFLKRIKENVFIKKNMILRCLGFPKCDFPSLSLQWKRLRFWYLWLFFIKWNLGRKFSILKWFLKVQNKQTK